MAPESQWTLRWVGFASGAITGGVRVFAGHPFDSLKVLMQTGGKIPNTSLKGALSLYRGILPPLASTGVLTSVSFGLYENTRLVLMKRGHPDTIVGQLGIEFIAGTIAGSILAITQIPLENIKVIQQTSTEQRSTLGWIKTLCTTKGPHSLFRGLFPHLMQSGVGRGFYLAGYFFLKAAEDKYLANENDTEKPSEKMLGKMLAGAGAGISGWVFTYPFDVARSNIMQDWEGKKYSSTLGCMRTLVSAGGISNLYLGLRFTLMRASALSCITLPTYDITRRTLLGIFSNNEPC
mmetsp:Transcript_16233/g.24475  ORF Transcript_16233/g.24475 Transcript_16233/m.24475 type:complete len:292 (-) Transcript_16233:81-956(-)